MFSKRVIILILSILSANLLEAHPHVFMTSKSTLKFNSKGLSSIEVELRMDEMASALFISDYDHNKDDIFDLEELSLIENYFDQFKSQNYFADLRIDEEIITVSMLSDFNVEIEDQVVIISYQFKLSKSIQRHTLIEWSLYDANYYNDIFFSQSSLFVEGLENFSTKFEFISEDASKAYYLKQVYPNVLELELKPKSDV